MLFDESAARRYGSQMAKAFKEGKVVSKLDGMIAAVAIDARPCTLATRDIAQFDAMRVNVVNPWQV